MLVAHLSRRVPGPTRVLCVDDSTDTTAVLKMMIDGEPKMECVGCLTSADTLSETFRRLDPPVDVVVLDATMPGKNPLEAMRELMAEFPGARVILYSGHDDQPFIDGALKAGAWGCISKSGEPAAIMAAVHEAASGKAWARPAGRQARSLQPLSRGGTS